MRKFLIDFVPGLLGGLVGGYLGYLIVAYALRNHGMWVPIIPGALAGLACGQLSWTSSTPRGIINGLVGLGIAIYTQWMLFNPPFEFDKTFPGYVVNLPKLPPLTLILIAVNGLIAFWWGREQRIGSARVKPKVVDGRPTEEV
jgi:hypothetical protein